MIVEMLGLECEWYWFNWFGNLFVIFFLVMYFEMVLDL